MQIDNYFAENNYTESLQNSHINHSEEMQECNNCGVFLESLNFYKRGELLHTNCKPCVRAIANEKYVPVIRELKSDASEKECKCCKITKPIEAFDKKGKWRQSNCKDCRFEERKKEKESRKPLMTHDINGNLVMKTCGECGENLPVLTHFSRNGQWWSPKCIPCRSDTRYDYSSSRQEGGVKFCSRCNIKHPHSAFSPQKENKDGLRGYCIASEIEAINHERLSTYNVYIDRIIGKMSSNAKSRKLSTHITADDIHKLYDSQEGICAISGRRMTHISKKRGNIKTHIINPDNISVDRIDSSKHYALDNIQLVCASINVMKSNNSDRDLIIACSAILSHKKGENNIAAKFVNKIQSEFVSNSKKPWENKLNSYVNSLHKTSQTNANKRSKELGVTYEITKEDIIFLYENQKGICALSGINMTTRRAQVIINHDTYFWNISLDRIDSQKGYVLDNMQLVCSVMNQIKSDMTTECLVNICQDIVNFKAKELEMIFSDIKQ